MYNVVMFYIVGLGNKGEEYRDTRHNAGRVVLERVLEKNGFPKMVASAKYAGYVSEGMLSGTEVTVLFPLTYMNNSGSSVRKLVTSAEDAKHLIVVYDEVDLPFGDLKISFGRGSGGHNGLGSVIDALGTKEFARIRVGIAPKSFFGKIKRPTGEKLTRHVLGPLKKGDKKALLALGDTVDEAVQLIIRDGVEVAMNRFNS